MPGDGVKHIPSGLHQGFKTSFSSLRHKGYVSTIYIDDACLQGHTYDECHNNVLDTVLLLDKLGFTVHNKKSTLIPSQSITFVGFILNSTSMTVRLTEEKIDKILLLCQEVLRSKSVSLRLLAKLIGKLVASEPGVEFAQLHYKPLEKFKEKHVKFHHGDYNAEVQLTSVCRTEIQWWIDNLRNSSNPISRGKPSYILHTDSSRIGWGAINNTTGDSTGGHWSIDEQDQHINFLELKACYLGLLSLCSTYKDVHIQIYMDNTTSCAYITHFGGKKQALNDLAREIWIWCIDKNIWLTVGHVPGVANIEADALSRKFNEDLEWSLNMEVFRNIQHRYGHLDIDLFASRLNHKLDNYVSFRPDPNAVALDAFSISWTNMTSYIFAPFSTLGMVLRKIVEDAADAIVIAPIWTTQTWWPSLLALLHDNPKILPDPQQILELPHRPERRHPLQKMKLGVFPLSGKHCRTREFRATLPISSYKLGEIPPRNNMRSTSRNGLCFQSNNKLIHLDLL